MLLWSNLWNYSTQITDVERTGTNQPNYSTQITDVEHTGTNQPEMFIELPQYSQLYSTSHFWDS